MKNVFRILVIVSLCLLGCEDSWEEPEASPAKTKGSTSPDTTCTLEICNGAKVCLKSDALHCGKCGNECPEGVPCVDGECTSDKPPMSPDPEPKVCDGKHCNDECVDIKTDVRHCGECDHACGDNQHCDDMKCACDDSLTMCSDVCVDLKTDSNNCGECGVQCGEGQHCSDMKCVCDDSLTMCSDVCADLKTDKNNCGACGTQCGEGLRCSEMKCVCDESLTMCSDVCVDLKTDKNNCGACGTQCGEGLHCSDMKCVCDEPLTMCSNVCANLKTDKNNCGACGTKCSPIQVCKDGGCKTSEGQKVIDYAKQFLYEDTHLCTYDHKDNLPGFQDFSGAEEKYNCGYNLNCANFVAACLINTGEMTSDILQQVPDNWPYSVAGLKGLCEKGTTAYRVIDPYNAQPGDIWYWKDDTHSHSELVVKVEGNKLTTLGSNNFAHNMSPLPCKNNPNPKCNYSYSTDSHSYQAVMYSERPITDGKVCSRR